MQGKDYAKLQLEEAFGLFNKCMQDLDESQYNWKPGGTCNTIAKSHVHALTAVDIFFNAILKGSQPAWPEMASKHGLPANAREIWKFEGTVPLAAMREYGERVQKDALAYVGAMADGDLDREVETNFFGKRPVAFMVQLGGMHTMGHTGEIATVKGMQGLKGLPF